MAMGGDMNVFPCFMPDLKCVEMIVDWIHDAKKSIIVQAYTFSSNKIADALKKAKQRGVKVTLLIDKHAEEKKNSLIKTLRSWDIEIKVDQSDGKAHNKVMIIDNEHVITGSYNWTDELYYHDSDVIVFIRNACVNEKFRRNHETLGKNNWESVLHFSQCDICKVSLYTLPTEPPPLRGMGNFSQEIAKKQKDENYVEVDVCFPRLDNRDCISLIVRYIRDAKTSIFIQASSLTHNDIYEALMYAASKRIDIRLLIDKKALDDKGEKISKILESDIQVRYDETCHYGIAHSKTIIIDDYIVLIGSLNLSYSGQNLNQENLVVFKNVYLNEIFKTKFCEKWKENCVVS